MSLQFKFDIFACSDKQKEFGMLANVSVNIVINGTTLVKLKGWNMRNGKNGPFLVGPSQKSNKMKDGKPVYFNYIQMFPRDYDDAGNATNDRSEEYKAFQGQALAAYNNFEATGGGNAASSAGSSLAPSQPAAQQSSLPQGWTQGVDTQSGRKYFMAPSGDLIFEDSGDPRLSILQGAAPAAKAPAASNDEDDIFAQFGAPGSL